MSVPDLINDYIASQPEPKQSDLQELHKLMRQIIPDARLWFLDGKDKDGKIVSNPNIGYGAYRIRYANGTQKDFYQIGLSANSSGISVYIMGLRDKDYLKKTYSPILGKASISGYCIKFKRLKDIQVKALEAAIRYGLETS